MSIVVIKTVSTPSSHVEAWETRFGKSVRVVERDAKGKFMNHKSAKQLAKIQAKASA